MIKPADIQTKEFSRKFKGYNCDEVDDFLDEIIRDYEILGKENIALKDQVSLLTKRVEQYREMEATMQQSLEVARKSAEDIRNSAQIEAQAIITKAKLEAQDLAKQIDEEHIRKHQEMLNVKSEVESYKSRSRAMCENMMKILGDF